MKDRVFITYGFHVDKEKFKPISPENKRYLMNKPDGGLWASPVDSEWGWKDWCEAEDFRTESFEVWTKWKLKDPSKILIIDSYEDFEKLMDKYGSCNKIFTSMYFLDFWKIKEDGWDGILLTDKGNTECHFPYQENYKGTNINLNSWDCESIVVWEWDQIKVIEKK